MRTQLQKEVRIRSESRSRGWKVSEVETSRRLLQFSGENGTNGPLLIASVTPRWSQEAERAVRAAGAGRILIGLKCLKKRSLLVTASAGRPEADRKPSHGFVTGTESQ